MYCHFLLHVDVDSDDVVPNFLLNKTKGKNTYGLSSLQGAEANQRRPIELIPLNNNKFKSSFLKQVARNSAPTLY